MQQPSVTIAPTKPSRVAVELTLIVFVGLFGAAAWKILSPSPYDCPLRSPEGKPVLQLARPDRVCPDIEDRAGRVMVTQQAQAAAHGRTSARRVFRYADVLGPVLGGGFLDDGLVGQQVFAGLPEHTPGWPLLPWQGWTVGPPPRVTSTVDAELSRRLLSILVHDHLHGAIILGTPDGELIACVQNPSADISRMGDPAYYAQALRKGTEARIPTLSNPWQWSLTPGSTIKPFLVAVARQKGIAPPHVYCRGVTTAFGRPLHCHRAHGLVDTYPAALAASCDQFFYELSRNKALEGKLLVSYAAACGLTCPALDGAICQPATIPWSSAEVGTETRALSFIGQGMSVSPLGLMSMYAAVAGQGRPQWRLVRKLDGVAVQYPAPQPVFDSRCVRAVRVDLGAVAAYGTTARTMRSVRQYQPLIKTGTAQVNNAGSVDSWAAGLFTVRGTKYVLCCLVRDWHDLAPRAQAVAASVVRQVAERGS